MNELVTVIIIIVIVISFFLHYESFYSELTYVKSSLDNRQYLVFFDYVCLKGNLDSYEI